MVAGVCHVLREPRCFLCIAAVRSLQDLSGKLDRLADAAPVAAGDRPDRALPGMVERAGGVAAIECRTGCNEICVQRSCSSNGVIAAR